MNETLRTGNLVVVGASAGGIEALSVLVGSLKKDFPAPVVLAQHLDPTRPSQLAGILERRTQLPVVIVGDDTMLANGHVYVVPSNRHVVIRDGHVGLESDHGDRPRPSVDLLLSSAARSYGERLIAVILTGSGSDGAAGAIEVKNAGGTVVIQNPETAAHPSMPLALPPTAVDHVVDLSQIGPLLGDLLTGIVLPEQLDGEHKDALADVMSRVAQHAAIDFQQYKPSTILRRLSRRMAVNHTRTLEEYRNLIDTHPQEVAELARSLLIKVTEFFRDPEAYSYIENDILPGIIEAARERDHALRLWSAGCATGEEAYSLALVLAKMLGNELHDWNVKIFATDVDHDAISFARRGLYPRNVIDNIKEPYRNSWVEPAEHGFRVSKAIRQMVIFGQQDLSRGVPFPRIDLVVCRNLLIYFKPELQQDVLDLFAYSLHQTRGFLFLGKAETARPSKSVFEIVNKKWKVYRCVSGPLPITVRTSPDGMPAKGVHSDPAAPDAALRLESRLESDYAQLRRANELLLRHLPVGITMIDRSYRIFSLNLAARRLLGIRDNAIDQDFLHSSRGIPYQDVRNAIDRVFRERSTMTLGEIALGVGGYGEGSYVSISVVPLLGEAGNVDFALVSITDVTDSVMARERLQNVEHQHKHVSEELNTANRRLTEMNKELQDANEELQAANEEMMLAQEELQATNEEFEATNEELQATNEELETNNEEMQATNEELETTNEELQARTVELQDLTRALSSERLRLAEMVDQAPFHSAVLRGGGLEIQSISEPLAPILSPGNAASDLVGRTLDEVCADPQFQAMRDGIHQVFVSGRPWSSGRTQVQVGGNRGWFLFTGVPSHNDAGQVDSVVLYADDVSAQRQLEESVRTDRLKLMLDQVDQVAMALFDSGSGQLLHGTERYLSMVERLLGMARAEATAKTWKELWFGSPHDLPSFESVRDSGQVLRLPELTVDEGTGRSVWDVSLIPVTEGEGTDGVHQIVLSAVEVTESARRREDLERVDRVKNEFLSLASHELRTPLSPLTTYTEVLGQLLDQKDRGEKWEAQVRDILERFRRQVRHMGRLTDDLLDVARLESGKFRLQRRVTRVKSIVDDAIEQSAGVKGPPVRLRIESGSDLRVEADPLRASQVVHNFLVNAARHAKGTPQIEVVVKAVPYDGRDWARIEVRDSGPGVPQAARKRLFSRYFQSGEGRPSEGGGLGLGLFIARQIVEQHGGRIGADFNGGSTFWMELPAIAD